MWENNLFNFFRKVLPKLTENLKKPFVMEGVQRVDDTTVHKAVREAFVNAIIHSDYLLDSVTLKIIKVSNGFTFTNPGVLKLPVEDIYKGGNSKSRNPRMQTMLRMIGYGDNAGSGIPTILKTWENYGWQMPTLIEDTSLNQVTLKLMMSKEDVVDDEKVESAESAEKSAESAEKSAESSEQLDMKLSKRHLEIIGILKSGQEYSSDEIAAKLGIQSPRTRQLLNELHAKGLVEYTAETKNRRYKIKAESK